MENTGIMKKGNPITTVLLCLVLGSGLLFGSMCTSGDDAPLFTFGVLADVQYSIHEPAGTRFYPKSAQKLRECVEYFNGLELSFVIQLGDFIDKDFKSIDDVLPIFNGLRMKKYHVLGNHDFAVDAALRSELLRIYDYDTYDKKAGYYDFALNDLRFIVLNGNEVSTYANPESSPHYKAAASLIAGLAEKKAPNAYEWNGGISGEQLAWLDTVLSDAQEKNERAFIFCHFPVFPENAHNLLNSDEVLSIIDAHKNVVAYINGHNHAGNYAERNGVHYITIEGIVETENENAYAIVEVLPDMLNIRGYGRVPNRRLKF